MSLTKLSAAVARAAAISLAMPAGPCPGVDEARLCNGRLDFCHHDRAGATEASFNSSGHSPGPRPSFSRRRRPAPRIGRGLTERTGHASRPEEPNIAGGWE